MVPQTAAGQEYIRECDPGFTSQRRRTRADDDDDVDAISGGVVACLNKRGDDDIHLCKPFWTWSPERIGNLAKQKSPISLELDKWRSRPSILLHELTHALFKSKFSAHTNPRVLRCLFSFPFRFANPTSQLSTKSGSPTDNKQQRTATSTTSCTLKTPPAVRD